MDKDNILQSQEQFIEKAFKSFEGNRLLNTLLKMEMAVKQFHSRKKLLNLILPTPFITICEIKNIISNGYPQGKIYLMDLLYYSKFGIRIHLYVYVLLFAAIILTFVYVTSYQDIDSIFGLIIPPNISGKIKLYFLAIVAIIIAIHVAYVYYVFIELLETFNRLKLAMLKVTEKNVDCINEILSVTHENILENKNIELDFDARNKLGVLISEFAAEEIKRFERMLTASKKELPLELVKKTGSKNSVGKKVHLPWVDSNSENSVKMVDDLNQKYQTRMREFNEDDDLLSARQGIYNDGIRESHESMQIILSEFVRSIQHKIDRVEENYEEERVKKKRLKSTVKGISHLIELFQVRPEEAFKETNFSEIMEKYLQIIKFDNNGGAKINIYGTIESLINGNSNMSKINNIGVINAQNSVINLDTIIGDVNNCINQLPNDDSDPSQPSLKSRLSELLKLIEDEKDLSNDDKVEAIKQVPVLAQAGQKPENDALKIAAKTSMKILRGTVASLPDTAKLAESCVKLLPLIANLLGF
jgi:hypothetical protein